MGVANDVVDFLEHPSRLWPGMGAGNKDHPGDFFPQCISYSGGNLIFLQFRSWGEGVGARLGPLKKGLERLQGEGDVLHVDTIVGQVRT